MNRETEPPVTNLFDDGERLSADIELEQLPRPTALHTAGSNGHTELRATATSSGLPPPVTHGSPSRHSWWRRRTNAERRRLDDERWADSFRFIHNSFTAEQQAQLSHNDSWMVSQLQQSIENSTTPADLREKLDVSMAAITQLMERDKARKAMFKTMRKANSLIFWTCAVTVSGLLTNVAFSLAAGDRFKRENASLAEENAYWKEHCIFENAPSLTLPDTKSETSPDNAVDSPGPRGLGHEPLDPESVGQPDLTVILAEPGDGAHSDSKDDDDGKSYHDGLRETRLTADQLQAIRQLVDLSAEASADPDTSESLKALGWPEEQVTEAMSALQGATRFLRSQLQTETEQEILQAAGA